MAVSAIPPRLPPRAPRARQDSRPAARAVLSAAEDGSEARRIDSFRELLSTLPETPQVDIDIPARRVTVNGSVCRLTHQEFDLLAHLARSAGEAVSRQELHAVAWRGRSVPAGSRTVDVHVRRLREKTGVASLVLTVRGIGYRLNPQCAVHLRP